MPKEAGQNEVAFSQRYFYKVGMEKVLVTGGTGFLGRVVVELLKASRFDVVSCSRIEGVDILDGESFKKFVKKNNPKIVVHCAAHTGGIAYNALHPVAVFEDNVKIGLQVVKACSEEGVEHLINIIPNCVYPGHLSESKESQFWDGAVHESVMTYALPRKMFWGLSAAYSQMNPRFRPIHLVLPNMYGPHDHFDLVRSHALGGLIAKIVAAKRNNDPTVAIWGTGKPVREWLYVEDGAQAILKTIENLEKFEPNEILNIGVRKGVSIKDLGMLIKKAADWNGDFIFQTEKPDGAMQKILVADKMKEKLNWVPKTQLEEGIQKTVSWYEQL